MKIQHLLTTLPQYILPHHALSRLMGHLTHCRNKTFKNLFIRLIIKLYKVEINEALETDINNYENFNQFFTRELKPEFRPLCQTPGSIASPADGKVSQAGDLNDEKIIQAKGKNYSVTDLLGGDPLRARDFKNGKFATIYLSPKDYHRLHMPINGTLKQMIYIPGRLFSVNAATTESVPELFARNERVVAIFDTEAGPMALVLVGAIFVASIETIWGGVITPPNGAEVTVSNYPFNAPVIEKGQEMGRFNMGSTIIVLFGENQIDWQQSFTEGKAVCLGEAIGNISNLTQQN